MKTKVIAAILTLAAAFGWQGAFAQKNLNDLMKRCESMPSVSMNIVQERNKETKEISKTIKNVTITNDKKLVSDFLTAFQRDRDSADKIIENVKNGQTLPTLYQFSEGERRISYTFDKQSDSHATVTYIERIGKGSTVLNLNGLSSFNSADFESRMEEFGKRMEAWSAEYAPKIEAWGEELGTKMEAWASEFAPQVEEWAKKMVDSTEIIVNGEKMKSK